MRCSQHEGRTNHQLGGGRAVPSEEFLRLLSKLNSRSDPPDLELGALRQNFESMALPAAPDIEWTTARRLGLNGELVSSPGARPDTILLYLHGGGFVMGSPRTHRKLAGDISRAARATSVVLDYPLAPEAPYPAAVTAVFDSYKKLLGLFQPRQLAIVGDSAGAALALTCCLLAKEDRFPLPAAVACLSPWVDLSTEWDRPSGADDADPIVKVESLTAMRSWYIGNGDRSDPLVSPVRADLSGLPALLVQAGSNELLAADARRLHEAATKYGTASTLELWSDMIHVWHVFAGRVPEATEAVTRVGEYLRDHLG